jgi:hypothetical protein
MRTLRLTLATVAALLAAGPLAPAADLLPANRPIHETIDHYIDARLAEEKVKAAPQIDDANLIRRLTLDLVGRIPTAAETKAFVESKDPDKRAKLVDRLMASPGYVRHQATELDAMLTAGYRASMRDYLLSAVKENRPWDKMFREMLLPDEKDPKQRGASQFLKLRVRDMDRLTAEVSVVFFGVNVSCAQCHDHPHVRDWKQDHFYGMKAFFSGTFAAGGTVAERDTSGIVPFSTSKGVNKQARMMFLTGKIVSNPAAKPLTPEELKKERERLAKLKRIRVKVPPPPPKFSARAALVEVALQPDQRGFFARSIVNRTWHRLLGMGLVSPLDQMHTANDPTHPELLEWLARDLVENKYDLRRLVRGIVLSKAYSRSSRWDGERWPRPQLFAVARLRALTPMQLATSLRVATTSPDALPATLKANDFEQRIEQMENGARGFASLIEQPRDDFQIGVIEALLFSNSERIQRELLIDGNDRLVGKLKLTKGTDEAIELAVRNVFSRPASAEEKKVLGEYLRARAARPTEAYQQMVWALLTSSEFRFNY